jgi:predicted transcriptional regulator
VPPSLDLRHWVDYRHHRKMFPVVSDGRLEGAIDTRALAAIPRSEWDRHTVAEVMRHDLRGLTVGPNADALEALGKMQRAGVSRLLVTEDDHLLGVLSLKDLLRFLNLKLALEEGDGRADDLDLSA